MLIVIDWNSNSFELGMPEDVLLTSDTVVEQLSTNKSLSQLSNESMRLERVGSECCSLLAPDGGSLTAAFSRGKKRIFMRNLLRR